MSYDDTTIPDRFQVAVVLSRKPSQNRWLSHSWSVRGVVVHNDDSITEAQGRCVRSDDDGSAEFLWGGIPLRLYKDQAESYYYNLMAPEPALYVILRPQTETGPQPGAPYPVAVTLSFDEANAAVETEDDARPTPMPGEIYRWVERFVLEHYVPERPVKRKRKNWKEDDKGG